jgi:hypothetical protein
VVDEEQSRLLAALTFVVSGACAACPRVPVYNELDMNGGMVRARDLRHRFFVPGTRGPLAGSLRLTAYLMGLDDSAVGLAGAESPSGV